MATSRPRPHEETRPLPTVAVGSGNRAVVYHGDEVVTVIASGQSIRLPDPEGLIRVNRMARQAARRDGG